MIEEKNNPARNEIERLFDLKTEIKQMKNQEETKPIDEITKRWGMNDKLIDLFADKIEVEKELKNKYAIYLIWILIAQLVLLNVWFALKGFGVISFSDTTFNIFISGGLAEVFLLVRVIVKYLFKDNLSELLKILVRTNNGANQRRNNKVKKENSKD